jgi:NADH:ubiquinone oxidoreductase subunit 6 (subunit J)
MFLVLSWVVLQIPAFRELSEAGHALAPVPDDSLQRLGLAFVDANQYVIPFEVASVMLLVAFIGAIVIAGDKK